jgi:hypothetical protein
MIDCLVDLPFECRFALSFGNGFFCLNPEGPEIVARTIELSKEEQKDPKAADGR